MYKLILELSSLNSELFIQERIFVFCLFNLKFFHPFFITEEIEDAQILSIILMLYSLRVFSYSYLCEYNIESIPQQEGYAFLYKTDLTIY